MRDDRERLLDISEAIQRIEKRSPQQLELFSEDEMAQVWVIHHLMIIGEAVRALSPEIRGRYPEMPWCKIIGMRNILVHGYFGVDVGIVWSVVNNDIPQVKEQIERMIAELGD